jgi:hypothetical protein
VNPMMTANTPTVGKLLSRERNIFGLHRIA